MCTNNQKIRSRSLWLDMTTFTLIMAALRKSKNELQAARMWSCGILALSCLSASFSTSILACFLVFTLLFKIDQMEKSIGFAFDEFESHCMDKMNFGTLFFNHSWFTLALRDGAESCSNVHGLRPKCLLAMALKLLPKHLLDNKSHWLWHQTRWKRVKSVHLRTLLPKRLLVMGNHFGWPTESVNSRTTSRSSKHDHSGS